MAAAIFLNRSIKKWITLSSKITKLDIMCSQIGLSAIMQIGNKSDF
jgi:hypothetical protein